MSRSFVAAVTAACVAFASCALVPESAQAEPVTVKSSKSNTSDRTGRSTGGVARTTTVKSSKSNTSDRMGGGGGVRGGGAPDKAIDLNSSRSNSNY
jgi:opacity protein-like surface antigen